MTSREIPEPWATAMLREGLTHAGRPSLRALALRAGVSPETARRAVHRIGRSSTIAAVDALAAALREDPKTVSGWAGATRTVSETYQPPAEAALLTPAVRRALDQLIRAIVLDPNPPERRSTARPMTGLPQASAAVQRKQEAADALLETLPAHPDAAVSDDEATHPAPRNRRT